MLLCAVFVSVEGELKLDVVEDVREVARGTASKQCQASDPPVHRTSHENINRFFKNSRLE